MPNPIDTERIRSERFIIEWLETQYHVEMSRMKTQKATCDFIELEMKNHLMLKARLERGE